MFGIHYLVSIFWVLEYSNEKYLQEHDNIHLKILAISFGNKAFWLNECPWDLSMDEEWAFEGTVVCKNVPQ